MEAGVDKVIAPPPPNHYQGHNIHVGYALVPWDSGSQDQTICLGFYIHCIILSDQGG